MTEPAVLAVDGGGSKVDAVLLSRNGKVLAAARSISADGEGARSLDYLEAVERGITSVLNELGNDRGRGRIARLGVYCLAGADLPADDRRIARWLSKQGWTADNVLRNDTFAVLRAGTDRTWGVGVVCGFGTNCSGVAPDGRTFRFPAVGSISGDWGGGMDIGQAALWYAVRAEDGRGDPTSLASLVPEHFGMTRPRRVMEAIYFGRMSAERVVELPPLVFRAAAEGDSVALTIVERQADEVVAMAGSAIRKLRMADRDVDVVLGGGIFRNRFQPFFDRMVDGLRRIAPQVRVTVLTAPPVVGAALLGLDRLRAPASVKMHLRSKLTHERLARMSGAPTMRER